MTQRGRVRVELRRVYNAGAGGGPPRVLVDRLWPRGIAKVDAPFEEWEKDVAPSTDLRRWYGHDPAKFDAFARRYREELTVSPAREGLERLRQTADEGGLVLITATRDVEHSAAGVLLRVLVGPE